MGNPVCELISILLELQRTTVSSCLYMCCQPSKVVSNSPNAARCNSCNSHQEGHLQIDLQIYEELVDRCSMCPLFGQTKSQHLIENRARPDQMEYCFFQGQLFNTRAQCYRYVLVSKCGSNLLKIQLQKFFPTNFLCLLPHIFFVLCLGSNSVSFAPLQIKCSLTKKILQTIQC